MSYELNINRTKAIIVVAVIMVIVSGAILYFTSVKYVGAGEQGVLTHWGAVDNRTTLIPGMHFIVPFQDDVIPINVQVQAQTEQAESASHDLQQVTTSVTVNYHADPYLVNDLYKRVSLNYPSTVITPTVQEVVKAVTAKYNAVELVQNRTLVKTAIDQAIADRLSHYDLVTDQISITDFNFSPDFDKQIEAKVTAQQQALTEENLVLVKQAQAQQAIAEAQGVANSTVINAEGQGKSIQIINDYLSKNPLYLEWLKVNKWDGHLPGTLVSGQGSTVPFINIPSGTNNNGT